MTDTPTPTDPLQTTSGERSKYPNLDRSGLSINLFNHENRCEEGE